MQQEDDLRALAKIMEFGRAVSIFLLVVHVYVYCYPSMTAWHLNLDNSSKNSPLKKSVISTKGAAKLVLFVR